MNTTKTLLTRILILFLFGFIIFSCNPTDDMIESEENETLPTVYDKAPKDEAGVMMQGFYWDVPMGGTWWNIIRAKMKPWADAGINSVWFPPVSKGESGPYSVGYDPFDYFDFGNFEQKGTIETRYGSRNEMQAAINAAHNAGLQVYADIVMNHNGGGDREFNPNTGTYTNTSFKPASGYFPRSYNDFHPSTFNFADRNVFKQYPDVAHANPWVAENFWSGPYSIAKYYKNVLGFDGWRFDWVDGFAPEYVRKFVEAAPGFAVTEFWGNTGESVSQIQACINGSGQPSFDFPAVKAMAAAFNGNNLRELVTRNMLCKANPDKAVTFVANHDIDEIPDYRKLQAYAFILAHEGIPCIFYSDYENLLNKGQVNTLIWIHKNLAKGRTRVLYADNDEYIAQMNGNPGLIIYINTSNSGKSRRIRSKWRNANLHDFANFDPNDKATNANGDVTLWAPANAFTIWSKDGNVTNPDNDTKTITLRIQKNVFMGNSIFFTGNTDALTNWGGGVEGNWNDRNFWTVDLKLPKNLRNLQWKVRRGSTGGTGSDWESGNNHYIANPVDGQTYTVTFNGGF